MKAILSLTIDADREDKDTPAAVAIKLYRDGDQLVWRLDGPLGDECETLPRPESVAQAKADARAVYPPHSPFRPRASWL